MATRAKSAKRAAPGSHEPVSVPPASNASEVPSVYANTIEMLSMNHIDVRIAFNEVLFESGNKPMTLRRANVVMPVPAFMMMVQILSANAQNLIAMGPQQAAMEQAAVRDLIQKGLARG